MSSKMGRVSLKWDSNLHAKYMDYEFELSLDGDSWSWASITPHAIGIDRFFDHYWDGASFEEAKRLAEEFAYSISIGDE